MAGELGEGDVVAGRYVVLGVIAEGGMGRVLAGRHLELDVPVAIKLLKREDHDARDIQRFRREARAAAHLRGEHVVRVLDVGVLVGERPFLVMERVDGVDLGTKLDADGPLPAGVAVDLVIQACEGLAEAHRLGMVHRDLKPSNLLLTTRPDGSALLKISDFGIAKWASGPATKLTTTADFLGSPKYMSPEQVREASEVDARSDVWSLGVTLYQLLTARLPFEAYTTAGVLAAITADEPVPPTTHAPELDPALEAVILRCLAKKPDARPQTTEELAAALAPFAGDAARASGAVARIASTLENPKLVLDPTPSERRPRRDAGERLPAPTEAGDADAQVAERASSATAGLTTRSRARPPTPPSPARRAALVAAILAVGLGLGWAAARSASAGRVEGQAIPAPPASSTLAIEATSPSSASASAAAAATATTAASGSAGAATSATPPRAPASAQALGPRPHGALEPAKSTATASAAAAAATSAPVPAATATSTHAEGLDLGPRK